MNRPAALALVAVCTLAACDRPAAPPGAQRLLETPVPITLGSETRLATGVGAELVVRHSGTLAAFPRTMELPAAFAGVESVVVNYQIWERKTPVLHGRRSLGQHTEVVRVDETGSARRVSLAGWKMFTADTPVKATLTVLPVLVPARRSFRASVTVPPNGFLRFGYGVREESWNDRAGPVRFDVRVLEAGGDTRALFVRNLDPRVADDRGWHDEHIGLDDMAGERVTFEFTATAAGGDGTIFLPTWSDPVVQTSAPAPAVPNVVIVSFDTLRARNLGCYGYPRDTSPFIDAIARAGTLFEHAVTTSATTSPSHMSLFTGRYPPHHGIRRGVEWKHPDVATLAELLRAGGYHTAAFTENGFVIRDHGFGNGVSEYTENVGQMPSGVFGEIEVTFAQARRWLARNRQLPFFLFVHTYQVHNPYNPPAAYAPLFRDDGLVDPVPQGLRHLRDNYDREIRLADDVVRTLFDTLAAAGLADSTIVTLLADHGEEFGEHGSFQHGAAVFDEVLRIPLIFWGPGRIPAGQRRSSRVSLVDVAPTVLDLAGLEVSVVMDGVSLTREIVEGGPLPPRTVFGEAYAPRRWTNPFVVEPFNPPLIGVLLGDTKFIVHRPGEGQALPAVAYRLEEDPYEERPLQVPAETLTNIDRLVDEYLNGSGAPDRGETAGSSQAAEPLDPEVLEKLRRLGYVE